IASLEIQNNYHEEKVLKILSLCYKQQLRPVNLNREEYYWMHFLKSPIVIHCYSIMWILLHTKLYFLFKGRYKWKRFVLLFKKNIVEIYRQKRQHAYIVKDD